MSEVFGLETCPVCGKGFTPAPQHVYKVRIKSSDRHVCSWSCVRTWEKKHEAKRKKPRWNKSN